MPRCTNCSTHVTVHFARVFGDNDDTVHNCLACSTKSQLEADLYRRQADEQFTWAVVGQ